MGKDKWAVGIDLGGTKIEIALVDTKGEIKDRQRFPTDSSKGYKVVLGHTIDAIKKIRTNNKKIRLHSIGIGVAGQIDKATGTIKYSPNLNWRNVSLQKELFRKLQIPVAVCNDVKAAMFGEWLHGSGKNCNDLVCVFVGTGIGGAIISGGKVLEGFNNTAGEIGHMVINIHGPQCHCGNHGCFEALAGGWAIQRDVEDSVKKNKAAGKLLLQIAEGDIKNITAKTIVEGLKHKDKLSKELTENFTKALIAGGTSIVNAFGPQRIIFGGGIIEGFPGLLIKVEKGIRQNALQAATASLKVLPAKLHNDSGVVGAAAFAFHTFKKRKK
jgi:glucokinase